MLSDDEFEKALKTSRKSLERVWWVLRILLDELEPRSPERNQAIALMYHVNSDELTPAELAYIKERGQELERKMSAEASHKPSKGTNQGRPE